MKCRTGINGFLICMALATLYSIQTPFRAKLLYKSVCPLIIHLVILMSDCITLTFLQLLIYNTLLVVFKSGKYMMTMVICRDKASNFAFHYNNNKKKWVHKWCIIAIVSDPGQHWPDPTLEKNHIMDPNPS